MDGSAIVIVAVLSFAWFVYVLAVSQRRKNSRVCPSCNTLVPQFDPVCRHCGFDFRIP